MYDEIFLQGYMFEQWVFRNCTVLESCGNFRKWSFAIRNESWRRAWRSHSPTLCPAYNLLPDYTHDMTG